MIYVFLELSLFVNDKDRHLWLSVSLLQPLHFKSRKKQSEKWEIPTGWRCLSPLQLGCVQSEIVSRRGAQVADNDSDPGDVGHSTEHNIRL